MAYQETFVQRDQHRIYVRDHPGSEPAIILMHGFPDNVHLYVPPDVLVAGREVHPRRGCQT
jgi:haloalkane dehalogenase